MSPVAGRAGSTGMGGSAGTAVSGTGGMTGMAGAGSGSGGSGGPSPECGAASAQGHFQLEDLDCGLVAVRVDGGNYVGWRMLGYEYDADAPDSVAYNVYRDGAKVATVTDSTNYEDRGAAAGASYTVSAVLGGQRVRAIAAVVPWAEQYLTHSPRAAARGHRLWLLVFVYERHRRASPTARSTTRVPATWTATVGTS